MSTTTQHTIEDLRASLLTACAAAGHLATLDARGERLIFTADGGSVPVKIESAFRSSLSSKPSLLPALRPLRLAAGSANGGGDRQRRARRG